MRTRGLPVALVGLLLVAGCSSPKSVGFYRNHPAWRARVADRCVSQGSRSTNCRNALQASFEVLGVPAHDGLADLPLSAAAPPAKP